MDPFLQIVASNALIAAALAVPAALATRARVNPAVVHVLWLLVLVKLFTPPVLPVRVPWPAVAERPAATAPLPPRTPLVESSPAALPAPAWWERLSDLPWQRVLMAVWGIGGVLMAVRYAARIHTVRRFLRQAGPAPDFLREMARRQSGLLGLTTVPDVVTLPCYVTPAVWSLGGPPRVVFPSELVRGMDRDRLETLMAHELAHISRKDHLVRLVELAATTVFWWHPVVWWGRTQLREMEEQACDALVLRTISHGARTYALALIETLEFLSLNPRPLPIGATAASPTVSLERRIEMLKHGASRRVTWMAALAGAAVFLPAMTVALAAESKPTLEISSEKDAEGQPKLKVVISQLSPEELSPQRLAALMELLEQDPKEGEKTTAKADGTRKTRTATATRTPDGVEIHIVNPDAKGTEGVINFHDPNLKMSGEGALFLRDGITLNLKDFHASGDSMGVVRGLVLHSEVEKGKREKGVEEEKGKEGDPPKKRVLILKKQDGGMAQVEADAIELKILIEQAEANAKLEALKAEKFKADAAQVREKALETIKMRRLEEARKGVPAKKLAPPEEERKGLPKSEAPAKKLAPPEEERKTSSKSEASAVLREKKRRDTEAAVKELHETAQKLTERALQLTEAMEKMEAHEDKAHDRPLEERRREAEIIKNLDLMLHDIQERAREIEKDTRPSM